jgi:exodeoxyribonuclease VII large subunit
MSQLGMFDRPPPGTPRAAWTVSEAVQRANRALEDRLADVCVEGEVSALRTAGSGHAFFTLKDERAALPVAMWRSSVERLRFRLEAGRRLRVYGRLGIYAPQGRFQLYADRAEPVGLGELMLQLEQLKAKLAAEGLFAPARKRPLPRWPRIVGVVTSRHGAAVHDILEVVRRRCPSRLLVAPAAVQGEGAAAELRRALHRLERADEVDVVIIGRGGGSTEDLWAFNDEGLARAIASFRVPVVSAVGHEVDVTIADLVADVRAATPSQAGALVVPDRAAVARELAIVGRRLRQVWGRRLSDERRRFDDARRRIERRGRALLAGQRRRLEQLERRLRAEHPRARLDRDRRRLVDLRRRLEARASAAVRTARSRLERALAKLEALSPLAVLERGYALVTAADGSVVTSAGTAAEGDTLGVRLHRGRLQVRVTGREDAS